MAMDIRVARTFLSRPSPLVALTWGRLAVTTGTAVVMIAVVVVAVVVVAAVVGAVVGSVMGAVATSAGDGGVDRGVVIIAGGADSEESGAVESSGVSPVSVGAEELAMGEVE